MRPSVEPSSRPHTALLRTHPLLHSAALAVLLAVTAVNGPRGASPERWLASLSPPPKARRPPLTGRPGLTEACPPGHLVQSVTVSHAHVDAADGKVHLRFALALVPGRPAPGALRPLSLQARLRNVTRDAALWGTTASAGPGAPAWKDAGERHHVPHTGWRVFDIAPGALLLSPGDTVELELSTTGCSSEEQGGRVYVDGFGTSLPGLLIATSTPPSSNTDTDLIATYRAMNPGPQPVEDMTVSLVLPEEAAFISIDVPGAACASLSGDGKGPVRCHLGTFPAASGLDFQVAVHIDAQAAGEITQGGFALHAEAAEGLLFQSHLIATTH